MQLNSAITTIKGIGEKTADSFAKMGVYTVGDILLRFPRTYVQYPIMEAVDYISTLPEGMHAILARVKKAPVVRSGRRMQVTVLDISGRGTDASMPGVQVQLIWYRMPYIKNSLKPGHEYVFYGKVITKNGRHLMEQLVIYEVEQYQTMEERFLPVYSLTAGITNNLMIKTIRAALTEDTLLAEPLPSEVRQAYQLCEYNYAIKQIHFPDSMDTLITARKRLVFDEFFLFIMGMQ